MERAVARIPQCDPLAGFLALEDEILQAVRSVLYSGEYILGSAVRSFERAFADYIGVPFAIGVASGTDAIHLALRAAGVGRGAEVITVSHTAVATVAAIEMAGAKPVFVDIDPNGFTIDPVWTEKAIGPRTKAIIAVHLYGDPASLSVLKEISERHGLLLIEDCAQAHGAVYRGKKVGSWGSVGCFSFYPTKNLGAIGDGGMVVTSDENIYHSICALRQYGWQRRYVSESKGYNSRLDELQAAVLGVKLKHLDQNNLQRARLAERYRKGLEGASVRVSALVPDATSAHHLFVIRSSRRDQLKAWLEENNISTGIHYPVPVHLQPAYRDSGVPSLPVTELVANEILSLPLYPEMSSDDVDEVVRYIHKFE